MLIVTTNRTRTTKAVGKTTRSILAERGIFSVEELANADIEQLIKIPGFGKSKATRMVRAAKYMIGESCRIGVV
ncbi:MAG: helix-hairpin-helix domain-containing protein, partial [Gammaproteobacteria bacterium]|nr:helix-hairpin-helix domain-containing protein [Gammaproteobacteria bacterium]